MNENHATANILKQFRKTLGKNLITASHDIGWSFSEYAKKENYPSDYTIIEICQMASYLDGSLDELFNAIEEDFKSYKNKTILKNIS